MRRLFQLRFPAVLQHQRPRRRDFEQEVALDWLMTTPTDEAGAHALANNLQAVTGLEVPQGVMYLGVVGARQITVACMFLAVASQQRLGKSP